MKALILTVVIAWGVNLCAQPTSTPASRQSQQGEIAQLRAMIRSLQNQLQSLREDNAMLRRQVADLKAKQPPSTAPQGQDGKLVKGMTLNQAIAALGQPTSKTEDADGLLLCTWKIYIVTPNGLSRREGGDIEARFENGVIKDFTDTRH